MTHPGSTKLIQFTDLHMMPPGDTICGLDPAENLRAAIAEVNAHHGDAALCVLSGDLAEGGDVAAYEVLRDCLAALRVPWRLMVGNHDDRANLLAVFPETPVDGQGFVQSRVELEPGPLLLLDTLDPGKGWGVLCERRLAWLDGELGRAGDRPVFVALHHPPFASGMPSMDRMALQDADAFGAVLARHGNVRHLFIGHLHRPIAGSWRGIPVSVLPGTNHQVRYDEVTERPVPKILEPPAFGVARLSAEATVVHMHQFRGAPLPPG